MRRWSLEMETVTDNNNERRYFTQICNLIDELDLSPLAIALYFHYKRWANSENKKSPGVKFLTKKYKVSDHSIKNAKQELIKNRLIKIKTFDKKLSRADEVTIIDIWERNFKHFQQDSTDPIAHERQVSDLSLMSDSPVANERQPLSLISDTKKEIIERKEKDLEKENAQARVEQNAQIETAPVDPSERLRFFPFLERQSMPIARLNEIADLFAFIAQKQNRQTLINEADWLDMCKQLEKEGMSLFGIKCLYRYCGEIAKLKTITPKVMNWKLTEYKQFVEQQQKTKPKTENARPFNPDKIELEKMPLPAGY
jgi:hypothetical protein